MPKKSINGDGKATIFDVAELAEVSIKTVSRVVNQEPNVRVKTKEKVLDAIERLNYQPNSAARGLSGKRSFVIGLVYENPNEFSYIGGMLKGALDACESEGYSLLLLPVTLPDNQMAERIRKFANQSRLDGMILPPPLADISEVTQTLAEMKIPHVAITPRVPAENGLNISCQDEQASFELTEYLIRQGHTRIGFIKGHPDHIASELRFSGYRSALERHDLPFEQALVQQGYFDFESGKQCTIKLLGLDRPPSVIIASNDDMAAGAMFEARELGVSVPEELSVVGFDDTPLASHIWPTLTTVRQPIATMAEAAASALISRLRGETDAGFLGPFPCELIIRRSSKQP